MLRQIKLPPAIKYIILLTCLSFVLQTAVRKITGVPCTEMWGCLVLRNGGSGVLLGGRTLDVCEIVFSEFRDTTAFRAVHAFYGALFDGLTATSVLDLACGLNPLYLGAKGYSVRVRALRFQRR